MAKFKADATVTITFETEIDTDEIDAFDPEEGNDLDKTDPDDVHDYLVDEYNDESRLIDVLNDGSFSVSSVSVNVEPIKASK